jgi:hypothetical protein
MTQMGFPPNPQPSFLSEASSIKVNDEEQSSSLINEEA